MASEEMNVAMIAFIATELKKGADLTQSEADAMMSLAYMCNPNGRGYVQMLKSDLARVAPHIKIND